MSELPDWIEDRIEPNADLSLQYRPVVEVFVENDRPFFTRRQVEAELDEEFTKDTVKARLDELCEDQILKIDRTSAGDLYWLNNEESDWPVPGDVVVEAKNDELTVSEFFDKDSVGYAALGVGSILISSLFIWAGGFLGAFETSIWFIGPTGLAAAGLFATFIGWILFGYGVFRYFQEL
ncbi:hypothetical protein [Haloarchaeobius sp. DFWS5]|uniref:hypothetical protein n=1 Tax=Haloarchaeobius sp. DFWS5 TaxID=3446114 RepID=UPI003EBC4547